MRSCIIDSGFLYALVDASDHHSQRVRIALELVFEPLLLPTPAITETAYFVQRNLGQAALVKFVESLNLMGMSIVDPVEQDLMRAGGILRTYLDQDIDFIDALIMAMAERLNITKILTVDRRHFQIFRPVHCEAFEILP